MGLTIVDASVVIAALDDADALHRRSTAALTTSDRLVLPASALAEAMVRPHRDGRATEVRSSLDALGFEIEPLTEAIADRAAALRARHASMRLGDALVLATAETIDADRILTGDTRWPGWSDRVEVVTPAPESAPGEPG
ncbi:MAG: PIN domain-containing protein [Chloroflexota bacterium]